MSVVEFASDRMIASILLFVFGTAIGSFLNVVSRRLLRGESPTGRSHCEHCGQVLSARDLVPLLSFIILRGRCRYCRRPLSWQYPLVEGGTGLLFVSLWLAATQPLGLLSYGVLLVSVSALIVIFITDFWAQKIFDSVLLIGVASALLYRILILTDLSGLGGDLLEALAVLLFLKSIQWVTRGRGLGDGDPPLGFFAALLVGFPLVLVQFFLAFVIGAAGGILLIALRKKHLKDRIAFGPFLVASALLTLFLGEPIWIWYLSVLGI